MAKSLRTLATLCALTAAAWLPQLLRTKVSTSATLASLKRQSKPGIANAEGAAVVDGMAAPCNTMRISDVASFAATVVLCAKDGNVRCAPWPLDWWQALQLLR